MQHENIAALTIIMKVTDVKMQKVPLWETHQSNFELTSNEKVDSMGVIASSAVCSQKLDCQNPKSTT